MTTWLRRAATGVLVVVCVCLVARAVVQPFLVQPGDAADYRGDWGGPSYLGVMAVHCLPGVVGAVVLVQLWRHRRDRTQVKRG